MKVHDVVIWVSIPSVANLYAFRRLQTCFGFVCNHLRHPNQLLEQEQGQELTVRSSCEPSFVNKALWWLSWLCFSVREASCESDGGILNSAGKR